MSLKDVVERVKRGFLAKREHEQWYHDLHPCWGMGCESSVKWPVMFCSQDCHDEAYEVEE